MGLMIHSLGELPIEAQRDYYVYLLDYGWKEDLGRTLLDNFGQMARLASSSDAVVMRGTVGSHFEDEVLSWHHVNGQPGDELLPAILITTRHPQEFRSGRGNRHQEREGVHSNMILIPLNRVCKTSTDVVQLVGRLFEDIRNKKALKDFDVVGTMKAGAGGAVVDALILQPNIGGIGLNLNSIIDFFRKNSRP